MARLPHWLSGCASLSSLKTIKSKKIKSLFGNCAIKQQKHSWRTQKKKNEPDLLKGKKQSTNLTCVSMWSTWVVLQFYLDSTEPNTMSDNENEWAPDDGDKRLLSRHHPKPNIWWFGSSAPRWKKPKQKTYGFTLDANKCSVFSSALFALFKKKKWTVDITKWEHSGKSEMGFQPIFKIFDKSYASHCRHKLGKILSPAWFSPNTRRSIKVCSNEFWSWTSPWNQ